jgi:hypothetical protein
MRKRIEDLKRFPNQSTFSGTDERRVIALLMASVPERVRRTHRVSSRLSFLD